MSGFILTFILFYEMLLNAGQQDKERTEPVFIAYSTLVLCLLNNSMKFGADVQINFFLPFCWELGMCVGGWFFFPPPFSSLYLSKIVLSKLYKYCQEKIWHMRII